MSGKPRLNFLRSSRGFTIIEIMVSITIITIVLGLIYFYQKQGWKTYKKAFQVGVLQTDARSALEQMAHNIKQASAQLIYVGSGFNSDIPLPEDAHYEKPYIYFAKPNFNKDLLVQSYDFYLYYVAKIKIGKDDTYNFQEKRGKIKMLLVKDQPAKYVEEFGDEWPILPPVLLEKTMRSKEFKATSKNLSFLKNVNVKEWTPEFSVYQSELFFGFTGQYDNLFKIRVNMYDKETNTKVYFETSVTPRN